MEERLLPPLTTSGGVAVAAERTDIQPARPNARDKAMGIMCSAIVVLVVPRLWAWDTHHGRGRAAVPHAGPHLAASQYQEAGESNLAPDALDELCTWDDYRLPVDLLPDHYNLTIELGTLAPPAMVWGSLVSTVARNVSMPAPSCVVFHAAPAMRIHDLEACGPNMVCEPARVVTRNEGRGQVIAALPWPVIESVRFRVTFSYPLEDKLTGLYHSRFLGVGGEEHHIATTQHEATSARETFPCWDEPAMKATFALTVHVPDREGLVALGNMPALGNDSLPVGDKARLAPRARISSASDAGEDGEALRRIRFDTSPRMSTYLVAVVVGELEPIYAQSRQGVHLSAWAPAATQQVHKLRFALAVATAALDYYESLFGVPFPLAKIDIVSIPDFGPGAMENWGLITYRATNVLADDESAPHDRQAVAATVVHELGHQWCGNLVTMRWWDELWLNEGFANYFEQAVTSVVLPSLQVLRQHQTYLSRALRADGSPDTHAVRPVKSVQSDAAVASLFDAISYDKAGAVIFMLHDYIERSSPGAFRRALGSYTEAHKYGVASGADMWAHMRRATGRRIDLLIEPWFTQEGFPLVEVTTLSDGSAVVLQTGRFLQDLTRTQIAFGGVAGGQAHGEGDPELASWWVPFTYFTSTHSAVRVGEIGSSAAFFSIPPVRKRMGGFDIDGADWLKLNVNGAGYFRVNYAPHLWERLVAAASEPGKLSDADLANLVDDAFALTLDGRLSKVTLSLARALGIRTAHETAAVTSSYESWLAMSQGLHLLLNLITGAALAEADGVAPGPGLGVVPARCVEDLKRFVRTQVIGRSLDQLLSRPPTRFYPHRRHRHRPVASRRPFARTQLEALSPPVLLLLASAMADERVGLWAYKALLPCVQAPDDPCPLVDSMPPDLQAPVLAVCVAFDKAGNCWRLALAQLPFAGPERREALMAALARAPTEQLLNATLQLTINASVIRPQDITSMIAMLANSPSVARARSMVWEFAKANVDTLSASGGGAGAFGFSAVLSNVAGGFASEEMAQDVQINVAVVPHLSVPDRIVRSVVGKIRSQAIWVQNYGSDTCTVLKSWHA